MLSGIWFDNKAFTSVHILIQCCFKPKLVLLVRLAGRGIRSAALPVFVSHKHPELRHNKLNLTHIAAIQTVIGVNIGFHFFGVSICVLQIFFFGRVEIWLAVWYIYFLAFHQVVSIFLR